MKEPKLKPCPFCGGEAVFKRMGYTGTELDPCYIVCTKCGMQTATTHETKTKQAKIWNRRAKT